MRHNQNRRSRGRNRKAPNPLTRSYESNGPDVKVRGTATHIAEKYGQLARDAQSSGDRVAAENYFQHAEHYNRIVAAAQAQQMQQSARAEQGSDSDDDRRDNRPAVLEQGESDKISDRETVAQSDEPDSAPDNERRRRRPRRNEQAVAGGKGEDTDGARSEGASQDGQASEDDAEPKRRRRKARAANGYSADSVDETAALNKNGEALPEGAVAASAEGAPGESGVDLKKSGTSEEGAGEEITAEGKAALAAFPD